MNPLDATIIRLGCYIGQLEAQVQELHGQLLEKTKELDAKMQESAARGELLRRSEEGELGQNP